jgi:hypothetical protein
MFSATTTRYQQGLGAIITRDYRDANYLARNHHTELRAALADESYELPPRYRGKLTSFIDQGARPFAVGAAWRHWLSASPMATKLGPAYDEIYRAARKLDMFPIEGSGATLRSGAEYMRSLGYMSNYLWLENVNDVRVALLLGLGPVLAASDWWTGFADPIGNEATLTGVIEGQHAYMLAGWDDPRGAGRIINSHGLLWGDKGAKWVASDVIGTLFQDGAQMCIAADKQTGLEARIRRDDYVSRKQHDGRLQSIQ